ncbi:MAG: mannose-1-phosphate guanyltransferase [Puniceicoccaceae bacterium]|nr:MAG: mannose-1-phosphate guanyltransferase [Puniceicoccaceae bacterium]
MSARYVVVMAGGKGERFWPSSRLARPKHLLPIVGDKPMLTQTLDRLPDLAPPENTFVITNREQVEAVAEACPALPRENIVAEPVGRDTCAAVALASLLVRQRDPAATFAILPADHVIRDQAGFSAILRTAFSVAEAGPNLVTIGIVPTEPATGYGYIQRGGRLSEIDGRTVYRVERFVEKPDRETALSYLDSGDYFWNAGMFVWQVATIDKALSRHTPSLAKAMETVANGLAQGTSLDALLDNVYPGLEKISVDYAIMERAEAVAVVPADFDWDDVGAWPAIARHFPSDKDGNVLRGNALQEGGKGNIVISNADHLVATVGCEDLIVVHTPEATLVCPKSRAQDIKKLVKRLEADPRRQDLV